MLFFFISVLEEFLTNLMVGVSRDSYSAFVLQSLHEIIFISELGQQIQRQRFNHLFIIIGVTQGKDSLEALTSKVTAVSASVSFRPYFIYINTIISIFIIG